MSLVLKHRFDHALVAAIVEAVKEHHPKGYLGRTAIQKLVYFLHVLDVPMQFKFRIHHFGPFCDELMGSLDWLQADDIVRDQSTKDKYSDYAPAENWGKLREEFEDQLKGCEDEIKTVAEVFGGMEPSELELIATLIFSYRWVHARGGNGPWRENAIAKFKEFKKAKFADQEIHEWYDKLVEVSLVEK